MDHPGGAGNRLWVGDILVLNLAGWKRKGFSSKNLIAGHHWLRTRLVKPLLPKRYARIGRRKRVSTAGIRFHTFAIIDPAAKSLEYSDSNPGNGSCWECTSKTINFVEDDPWVRTYDGPCRRFEKARVMKKTAPGDRIIPVEI